MGCTKSKRGRGAAKEAMLKGKNGKMVDVSGKKALVEIRSKKEK